MFLFTKSQQPNHSLNDITNSLLPRALKFLLYMGNRFLREGTLLPLLSRGFPTQAQVAVVLCMGPYPIRTDLSSLAPELWVCCVIATMFLSVQ